jgi:S-DNA-T family DNA segregation ATPase FtsK/SpoIIIE
MDFSSATLNKFKVMPHCGGVVLSDEEELITRLLKLIKDEMQYRRNLFHQNGVGNYQEYIKIKKIPQILFIIDNFAVFKEDFTDYIDDLIVIVREGIRYGIVSIIIDNDRNNMSGKLNKNIINNITLKLTEKVSYLDVLKVSPSFTPSNCKGRGLINDNGKILEFQSAVLFEDVKVDSDTLNANRENEDFMKALETKRTENIKAKMESYTKFILKKNGKNPYAKQIPFIPRDELYPTFFKKSYKDTLSVPIGYDCTTIDYYYLDLHKTYCYSYSSTSLEGINLMLNNFILAGKFLNADIYAINLDSDVFINGKTVTRKVSNPTELFDFMTTLRSFMVERTPVFRKYQDTYPNKDITECVEYMDKKFKKVFVVIDSLEKLCEQLYDTKNFDASKGVTSMSSFFEEFLEKGSNRGIYFFAGIKSEDFTSRRATTKVWRNFVKDKKGLHTGGHLEQQRIVACQTMRSSEQAKAREYNTAHTNSGNALIELYVPKPN